LWLGGVVCLLALPASSQSKPPLTHAQLLQLIQVAPDEAIAKEVETRGLAFAPSDATLVQLRHLGAGPKTLAAVELLIPALDEARRQIPPLLDQIYRALNQGERSALQPYVFNHLLDDTRTLDNICPPFGYKAHYIESVTEPQRRLFSARVRFLSRDLKERIYDLVFAPVENRFLLQSVSFPSDPFPAHALREAADVARRLAYAACARDNRMVDELSTPAMHAEAVLAGGFIDCNRSTHSIDSVSVEEYFGLKVRVNVDGVGLFVDRVDDRWRVVRAVDWNKQAEDPQLRNYTLRRFNLPLETVQVSPPPPAPAPPEPEAPAQQPRHFSVRHRHRWGLDQNWNMIDTYCEGILSVFPEGHVQYVCKAPDNRDRCEKGRFPAIKEVRLEGEHLRIILLQGGNWDFYGAPEEMREAFEAIAPLKASPQKRR
jgi:hypothetical protein